MYTIRLTYYMLLISFKDFGYWFWTLFYPLLMATLFILTTSNADDVEIDDITVGIEADNPLAEALESVDFIDTREVTENEALDMLDEEGLTGFVDTDGTLLVSGSGFEETVLESVLNQMVQMGASEIPLENFDFTQSFISETDLNSNPVIIIFYALIGMISFYSMFSSIELVTSVQANLSGQGARFNATPVSKLKFLFANAIGSLILGLFSNTLIIAFLMIFNDEPLFDNLLLTFLLIVAANITGICIGFAIGLIPGLSVNFKTIFAVVTILVLAFLSGMVGPEVKMMIEDYLPFINIFNPVAQMTDTMLRINLLGNYDDYLSTIIYLLGIAAVFFVITLIGLRRKQYDNI